MTVSTRTGRSSSGRFGWKDTLLKLWSSATFKVVLIFSGTLAAAGYLVYWFEHERGNTAHYARWWDGLWWGIVTITTTGYGDKIPETLGGRVVAGLTMIVGIIVMGVVTGQIASWLVERQFRLARGLANLSDKTGHLVICGWRRDMAVVLDEIVRLTPDMPPEDIAIIAPITQETLETFKTMERFSKIHILRGEYFTQSMLERAGIRGSSRVLILADASGSSKTPTEIDAKTVMTAMTVDRIAPRAHVTAELLDLRFESYLKTAHCDEIVYSNEYARILLANSVKSAGLAHVIYGLLDVGTDARIRTNPIPADLVGRTFAQMSAHFKSSAGSIAIGLIENTGKIQEMKKEALRQAQKNPNTRTVLRNLKEVRNIGANFPVLNPPKNYTVKPHSRAVVIENADRPGPTAALPRRSASFAAPQGEPVHASHG